MAELNNNPIKPETFSTPIEPEVNEVWTNDNVQSEVHNADRYNDPTKINITLADRKSPIVVLFGPPASGKTMTLIRLTRYLKCCNYGIFTVRNFRPSDDLYYQDMCDTFNDRVNESVASPGTPFLDFMLVDITRNAGQRVCQILEAPGGGYHNPTYPNRGFARYVDSIINAPNRKIWIIMVEPNWKFDHISYVDKVKKLRAKMRPSDKVVFLYNKIDDTGFVRSPGNINTPMAIKDIEDKYPGVFEPFKNVNPITRLFKKYNCHFVAFSTGSYHEATDGTVMYNESDDIYPAALWSTIIKCIRG